MPHGDDGPVRSPPRFSTAVVRGMNRCHDLRVDRTDQKARKAGEAEDQEDESQRSTREGCDVADVLLVLFGKLHGGNSFSVIFFL